MLLSHNANIVALIFLGLGVGILSGFAGVGGGFFLTPALIILGFPANYAVGTSITWILGNSIVGVLRHRKLGNVDPKLGFLMIMASISGMEIGVITINWMRDIGLADVAVLCLSITLLLTFGFYILIESIKAKKQLDILIPQELKSEESIGTFSKRIQNIRVLPMLYFPGSGVTISLWIIVALGFIVGVLAGFIGVGGGFIIVPSLVYFIGLSSFMAVGTSFFQIVFSSAYGAIRHTMNGNVDIYAAFIMLLSSSIGVHFGASITQYVRGVSARLILGTSILFAALASLVKLASLLIKTDVIYLELIAAIFILIGLCFATFMILTLYITAKRYRSGKPIPLWLTSLVIKKSKPDL